MQIIFTNWRKKKKKFFVLLLPTEYICGPDRNSPSPFPVSQLLPVQWPSGALTHQCLRCATDESLYLRLNCLRLQ